ncbi:MAG TPA: hypothetical protein VEL74_19465 [Thermoanaerobaculia bacterium]|nr:hypothetical protein [Thermoanaerobaculia bacterium]
MDVSNTTGSDSDYKVTGGGGTRGPGGWIKLPGHRKVRHEVEHDEGPWKIEFKVAANGSEFKIFGRCNDPDAHVVLVERGGAYGVDVQTNGH